MCHWAFHMPALLWDQWGCGIGISKSLFGRTVCGFYAGYRKREISPWFMEGESVYSPGGRNYGRTSGNDRPLYLLQSGGAGVPSCQSWKAGESGSCYNAVKNRWPEKIIKLIFLAFRWILCYIVLIKRSNRPQGGLTWCKSRKSTLLLVKVSRVVFLCNITY